MHALPVSYAIAESECVRLKVQVEAVREGSQMTNLSPKSMPVQLDSVLLSKLRGPGRRRNRPMRGLCLQPQRSP